MRNYTNPCTWSGKKVQVQLKCGEVTADVLLFAKSKLRVLRFDPTRAPCEHKNLQGTPYFLNGLRKWWKIGVRAFEWRGCGIHLYWLSNLPGTSERHTRVPSDSFASYSLQLQWYFALHVIYFMKLGSGRLLRFTLCRASESDSDASYFMISKPKFAKSIPARSAQSADLEQNTFEIWTIDLDWKNWLVSSDPYLSQTPVHLAFFLCRRFNVLSLLTRTIADLFAFKVMARAESTCPLQESLVELPVTRYM